jgi:hypothetical protein
MPLPLLSGRAPAFCGLVALAVAAGGCAADLKWRVIGTADQQATVDALRLQATPVDTAELKPDHPFCWRGSETAGFMLFDVSITNSGTRDLLCQVGHLDFPGVAAPQLQLGNFLEGAIRSLQFSGQAPVLGTEDMRLAALPHEKASILMAEGYRYEILSYMDFSERYNYLMQKEMERAMALAHIPYVGIFIAMSKMRTAADQRATRLMQAQQMVMRPGVVPAGRTVRGYLVFAWPPNTQAGDFTLRMPVQPAYAATLPFQIVSRH